MLVWSSGFHQRRANRWCVADKSPLVEWYDEDDAVPLQSLPTPYPPPSLPTQSNRSTASHHHRWRSSGTHWRCDQPPHWWSGAPFVSSYQETCPRAHVWVISEKFCRWWCCDPDAAAPSFIAHNCPSQDPSTRHPRARRPHRVRRGSWDLHQCWCTGQSWYCIHGSQRLAGVRLWHWW